VNAKGLVRRVLVWGAWGWALYYAIQGGEYSTMDLLRQRMRERELRAAVESLQRAVDSLRGLRELVRTDPVTQERIAREQFGMVRGDREILYRFVSDTGPKAGR
jgi:cell division protein FtsB